MNEQARFIRTTDGRWLAVTGEDQPVRVGVVSDSRELAARDLESAVKRWLELLQEV